MAIGQIMAPVMLKVCAKFQKDCLNNKKVMGKVKVLHASADDNDDDNDNDTRVITMYIKGSRRTMYTEKNSQLDPIRHPHPYFGIF